MNNYFSKSTLVLLWLTLLVMPWSKAIADIDDDFSAWGAVQGQGSFVNSESEHSQWQWWMEGQGRLFNDAGKLGQSIIRPGVGYKLSDNVSLWAGYAWVNTSPLGGEETDEHRIWQQLSWGEAYSWGKLATRTRLEQRFLSNGDDTGWRYRQLLKYTHPLFSQKFYISVWDEVFVNINSTDWGANSGFGQNRVFAGLGMFIDSKKHYRFELGYINQFIDRKNRNDLMNHIISGSLSIRF